MANAKEDDEQPFEQAKMFKAVRKLLNNTQKVVANMNRAYKYTTGTKLLDSSTNLAIIKEIM